MAAFFVQQMGQVNVITKKITKTVSIWVRLICNLVFPNLIMFATVVEWY
jgi:hypothetical protein